MQILFKENNVFLFLYVNVYYDIVADNVSNPTNNMDVNVIIPYFSI